MKSKNYRELRIYMTKELYNEIGREAEAQGLSMSRYGRKLIHAARSMFGRVIRREM